MDQLQRDLVFLRMAAELATLSHCVSHRVACLFVKRGRIITSGINGTPEGYKNCDEVFDRKSFDREEHHQWSNKHEIHAEANVLIFAAKHGISLDDATVYSTLQPCQACVKNLIPSGIIRVVFAQLYDKADDLQEIQEFYESFKIPIVHVDTTRKRGGPS